MRRFLHGLKRIETWGPFAIAGSAFILAAIFISREDISLIVRAIDIAAWIAICMAFIPVLFRILRSDELKKDQYLVTGILILWNALGLASIWTVVFILLGRPETMQNSLFTTFCWASIAFSSYYFIKVPGTSKVGWTYTSIVFAISVLIIVFFYTHSWFGF